MLRPVTGGLNQDGSLSFRSRRPPRCLAKPSLPTQIAAVEQVVIGNADLMAILRSSARRCRMPGSWRDAFTSPTWNALTGRVRATASGL